MTTDQTEAQNMPVDLAKVIPLTPTLRKLVDKTEADLDPEDAKRVLLDVFLSGVEPKEVRPRRGEVVEDTVAGFLSHVPAEAIARYAQVCIMGASGAKWSDILGGNGFALMQWAGTCYPVLALAWSKAKQLRAEASGERALERLETIADGGGQEIPANARVKACEILLRANHPAFGHQTEAKTGTSTRPIVNINLAAFVGEDFAAKVGRKAAEIVEAGAENGQK